MTTIQLKDVNTENLSNLYIQTFNGLQKVSHVCKETCTVTVGNIYDRGFTIPCHAFTELAIKEQTPVVTTEELVIVESETPLEVDNTVQDAITENQKQLLLATVQLSIYNDYIFKLDSKKGKQVLKQLRADGVEIKVKLNDSSHMIGKEIARLLKVGYMRPLWM